MRSIQGAYKIAKALALSEIHVDIPAIYPLGLNIGLHRVRAQEIIHVTSGSLFQGRIRLTASAGSCDRIAS